MTAIQDNLQAELLADLMALQILTPLSSQYAPWNGAAMRPSALVHILNEIAMRPRMTVMELGSGISTLYIGRLLEQLGGGILYAVEHDFDWFCWFTKAVNREGLSERIKLIYAPLTETEYALNEGLLWYDVSTITTPAPLVDLLIIDGPPAWQPGAEMARYPALPALYSRLNDECTIILDDAHRDAEKKIVRLWEQEFGLDFFFWPVNGSIAVAQKKGTPPIYNVPLTTKFGIE